MKVACPHCGNPLEIDLTTEIEGKAREILRERAAKAGRRSAGVRLATSTPEERSHSAAVAARARWAGSTYNQRKQAAAKMNEGRAAARSVEHRAREIVRQRMSAAAHRGGINCAANMSPEERGHRASNAAKARWANAKPVERQAVVARLNDARERKAEKHRSIEAERHRVKRADAAYLEAEREKNRERMRTFRRLNREREKLYRARARLRAKGPLYRTMPSAQLDKAAATFSAAQKEVRAIESLILDLERKIRERHSGSANGSIQAMGRVQRGKAEGAGRADTHSVRANGNRDQKARNRGRARHGTRSHPVATDERTGV